MYLRSKDEKWRVTAIEMINNKPLPQLSPTGEQIWASDHYGLQTTLMASWKRFIVTTASWSLRVILTAQITCWCLLVCLCSLFWKQPCEDNLIPSLCPPALVWKKFAKEAFASNTTVSSAYCACTSTIKACQLEQSWWRTRKFSTLSVAPALVIALFYIESEQRIRCYHMECVIGKRLKVFFANVLWRQKQWHVTPWDGAFRSNQNNYCTGLKWPSILSISNKNKVFHPHTLKF